MRAVGYHEYTPAAFRSEYRTRSNGAELSGWCSTRLSWYEIVSDAYEDLLLIVEGLIFRDVVTESNVLVG